MAVNLTKEEARAILSKPKRKSRSTGQFACGNGKAAKWIFDNANHEGDDCLTWPFGRSANGYGSLTYNWQRRSAHKMMCEVAHGKQEGSQALHSCGKGHLGCVNPKHLRWGTAEENMADKLTHGTHNRGDRQYQVKLTEKDVLTIRDARGVISEDKLAVMFGVSRGTIACVMQRRTWAWL